MQPVRHQWLDKKHQRAAGSSLAARIWTGAWHPRTLSFHTSASSMWWPSHACSQQYSRLRVAGTESEMTFHLPWSSAPPDLTHKTFTHYQKWLWTNWFHPEHNPHHKTSMENRLLCLAFCFLISDWKSLMYVQIPHIHLQNYFWLGATSHSLSCLAPLPQSVNTWSFI